MTTRELEGLNLSDILPFLLPDIKICIAAKRIGNGEY